MRHDSFGAAFYKAGNLGLGITIGHRREAGLTVLLLAIRRADRRIMLALVSKPMNRFALVSSPLRSPLVWKPDLRLPVV